MRGQSATEYFLLVAVAIIAGLAAISILSYNGGQSGGANQVQTDIYWATLRPAGISNGNVGQDGKLTVRVENKETKHVLITGVEVGGVTVPIDPVSLQPGQSANIAVPLSGGNSGGGGGPPPESPSGICQFHGFCLHYTLGELGGLVECGNMALVAHCPQSCIPEGAGCFENADCCSNNCNLLFNQCS